MDLDGFKMFNFESGDASCLRWGRNQKVKYVIIIVIAQVLPFSNSN